MGTCSFCGVRGISEFRVFSVILTVGFVAAVSATLPFKVTDCSTSPNKLITVENIVLTNDPVPIPGNESVSLDVHVLRPIAGVGHYTVNLRVQRHVFNGYVQVPCVEDVGSCTYDLCTILDGHHYNTPNHCPQEIASSTSDFPCSCPFAVGDYHLNPTGAQIGELPFYLKWLGGGDYKAEAKVVDTTTGEEVGCFILQLCTKNTNCVG